jgi:hypothetical protein
MIYANDAKQLDKDFHAFKVDGPNGQQSVFLTGADKSSLGLVRQGKRDYVNVTAAPDKHNHVHVPQLAAWVEGDSVQVQICLDGKTSSIKVVSLKQVADAFKHAK